MAASTRGSAHIDKPGSLPNAVHTGVAALALGSAPRSVRSRRDAGGRHDRRLQHLRKIRMAVGQLLDYGRFVSASSMAGAGGSRPRADLLAYLAARGVAAVYPTADGWTRE